jgi:hypothetical protein
VAQQENGLRTEWFSMFAVQLVQGRDVNQVEDWAPSQRDAAEWLRTNSDVRDVVGTNLTLGPYVSAITHRGTYVSGILYQSPYGREWIAPVLLMREQDIWEFIDSPNTQGAQDLCAAGVKWLWVDRSRTAADDWGPEFTTRFTSEDTFIAEANPELCSSQ